MSALQTEAHRGVSWARVQGLHPPSDGGVVQRPGGGAQEHGEEAGWRPRPQGVERGSRGSRRPCRREWNSAHFSFQKISKLYRSGRGGRVDHLDFQINILLELLLSFSLTRVCTLARAHTHTHAHFSLC